MNGDRNDDGTRPGGSARERTAVGWSGSGASRRALRWALREAAASGRAVHVVAVDPPSPGDPPSTAPPSTALPEALAEELERLPGRCPPVSTSVVTGDVATALLVAASGSRWLVLGCGRGVGPVGTGDGDVLARCLAHCPAPVVLVGPQAVLADPRRLLAVRGAGGAGAGGIGSIGVARTGTSGAAVARAVHVGDLVVAAAADAGTLPLRTLRAPVAFLPPSSRTVVLPDTAGAGVQAGRAPGRSTAAGTQLSTRTGRPAGSSRT
ncbi:universal stress protein [Kineococcus auxinigenes]|uniref:universal stress protein n=1 Tax=unclassified Kineococcus TaxID=2621656 RepID=UPI003D7CAF20